MKRENIPFTEPAEKLNGGYQEYLSLDKMGSYTGVIEEPETIKLPDGDDFAL